MIEILGVELSTLCLQDKPEALLDQRFFAAWQERHKGMREGDARRASLVGLLLLQAAGVRGELAYDRLGRPYLPGQHLDFNISHTGSGVFCAVERGDDKACGYAPRVGIDAEEMRARGQLRTSDMARRWFSENEQATFFANPTMESFLRIWTRKEALVKWLGEGIEALKRTDTVNAEAMHGVRFQSYTEGKTLITLCHSATLIPPSAVHMLTGGELARLCGQK